MDYLYNELEEMCGYDRDAMSRWLADASNFLDSNWEAYEEDDCEEEEYYG